MHLDVQDLRNFYYRNQLGRAVQNAVGAEIRGLWPEAKGQTVAGYGFAVPFLRPYLKDSRRVIALMPAPQGVIHWPADKPNISVLCEETLWPLETGRVDKLMLVHGLETCERPGELLEECWRVLGPGGSALFVVPNRAGLWSRSDRTPFGYGRPYSQSQLESQLKTRNFLPERHVTALYQPPSHRKFWRKTAGMWENMGGKLSVVLKGGVLIVQATKRVHAPTDRGSAIRDTVRSPLGVLKPKPSAQAKPV
ncbi:MULTISPECIES: class I SAM-dependent methyltransferase [Roseovarius]|uniref:class I SAM-dependent methyltransferase n=1 Tax=Roseovarius TaxID=74030 RepID=UPI001C96D364|nr:methyltransferase domain-containing protein [Roseovarius atlanticus]MBY5986455.1 class I SAM-dependent methyltransferase [Roseovarius atlanticus]MBY6125095.1 class I SAM-dependent methyltransferase [Roseovarius atlanticus]MBY6150444.1 class I SAM-dependent methyltransferase [Roseovarius atlanticus]